MPALALVQVPLGKRDLPATADREWFTVASSSGGCNLRLPRAGYTKHFDVQDQGQAATNKTKTLPLRPRGGSTVEDIPRSCAYWSVFADRKSNSEW